MRKSYELPRGFWVVAQFLVFALFLAPSAFALPTCHVIWNSTNGGTNAGTSWTNPYNGSASVGTWVYGDIYYVGGGSGGSYTSATTTYPFVIGSSTSGVGSTSNRINVYAATVADHGQLSSVCANAATIAASNWNAATMAVDGGAGQVNLQCTGCNGLMQAKASNVFVDGLHAGLSDTSNTWGGPGHSCSGTQCGFLLNNFPYNSYENTTGVKTAYGFYISAGLTDVWCVAVQFEGIQLAGHNQDIDEDQFRPASGGTYNGIHLKHSFLHETSRAFVQARVVTGLDVEYNLLYRNHSTSANPSLHGEAFDISGDTNDVVAFNVIEDVEGTGAYVALTDTTGNTVSGTAIYGNVFITQSGNPNGVSGYDNAGIVGCINTETCTGWLVYNNTAVNLTGSGSVGIGITATVSGSSITAKNNLWYISSGPQAIFSMSAGNTISEDHNSFLNSSSPSLPGTGDVVDATPPNPFPGWTSLNFHLGSEGADWNSWTSLSSPYNVDPDGVTRTTDRGAFQFVAGAVVALGTAAISSLHCAAAVNTPATGLLSTDVVIVSFNAAPSGAYLTGLTILPPDVAAGSFNIRVCNPTAGSLIPPAATLNWRVVH